MALLELSMVTGAIVEMSVDAVAKKLSRKEAIIKTLQHLRINAEPNPDDFEAIYTYTLVEWGVFKPEPVLNFFRNELIRVAFRQAFYENDRSILEREAEDVIDWNKETQQLGRITGHNDPRREFAAFTAVFDAIVDRTRTPAEVNRDRQIEELHQHASEILNKLEKLSLDEIRNELIELQQSYRVRQFVFTPSGEKLKVFVSSRMLELRDLREILDQYLETRGLDVWIYEDDGRARPGTVIETSLKEIEAADIYVGLFWQEYGKITIEEYRYAREVRKPCFIYIRDKDLRRAPKLEDFLKAEVYDPKLGVTFDFFDRAQPLVQQVADDIMAWLVREHRNMTAEIYANRISHDEAKRLQAQVDRLQAASRQMLPMGTPTDYLARQMREWFQLLGYTFEEYAIRAEDHFEWLINVPARRGYDRVLVRGMAGEATLSHMVALRGSVNDHNADEGWVVTTRRISQAARNEANKGENQKLFCYTFDELIDENANFSGYIDWLESEVRRRGIDKMYVSLAAVKEEIDPRTKKKIGESRYDDSNGWIDGYIDRWLDDPSKEHISILGEFGTGKTWFALHYAWRSLQAYKDAKNRAVERPRLPLVIPLRDYAKAVSIESLFSEFFFRKYEIPLSGYSAFEQLNRMGKLLLIFDGFDEMAARIDRQQMINNFWELARVVVPGAKVILTCRNEHFPTAQEGRKLLSAELLASTTRQSGEPPQFEVLELQKFQDEQIRTVLSYRMDSSHIQQIMDNHQLLDLVRRPVMTEIIMDAVPDIKIGKPIDLARVYLYAVCRKMERDIQTGRTFTSLADKLYFMCELSWEMLSTEQMSLNYRDFPERLRKLFPHTAERQKDLDYWHYDMMGQTIMIRNAEGDYSPAHRSLLEFFVAFKFASELGLLARDFLETAQSQSHIDTNRKPENYDWHAYFRRETDIGNNVIPIAPLKVFQTLDINALVETLGRLPFSKAILDIIVNIVDVSQKTTQRKLLEIVDACKNCSFEETGYLVSNIVLMLLEIKLDFFKGKDLSNLCMKGLRLESDNTLPWSAKFADMSGTNFENSDLRDVDFGVEEQISYFNQTNFKNALLDNFTLHEMQLDEMSVSAVNNVISLTSPYDIVLLDKDSFRIVQRIFDTEHVWRIQFSPDEDFLVQASHGGFTVRKVPSLEFVYKHEFSLKNNPDASEPDNPWTSSFVFSRNSNLLIAGCNNAFIYFYDLVKREEIRILKGFRSVSELSLSPNEKYLISSSFHEFILWDLSNFEIVVYENLMEKDGYDKDSLVKYVGKFHPFENEFVLIDDHTIRFFDTNTLEFNHTLEFESEDLYFRLSSLCFSSDGKTLFVGTLQDIYIIEYESKSILGTLKISGILEGSEHFVSSDEILTIDNEIAVDKDGNTLYIFYGRYFISIDLRSEQIMNVYHHLGDFRDADFSGAQGLDSKVVEQLYKNGAIVSFEN